METTDRVVREGNLTTLMVTHNLEHALRYGNRMIMLHEGTVVLDVCDEEKERMRVQDVLRRFHDRADMLSDRMLLK